VAFAIVLFVSYLFYIPFTHWTYLRFLLPAIPILIVLTIASVDAIASAISDQIRWRALAFIALVLPMYYVAFANHGDAFALKRLFEDRYVVAGRQIARETPESAIVVGLLQTGSLTMYAHRTTVRYDVIPPDWIQRAIAFLSEYDLQPYVALEATEESDFRRRGGPAVDLLLRSGNSRRVDPLGLVTLYGPFSAKAVPSGVR
jgi:hypothetical protein